LKLQSRGACSVVAIGRSAYKTPTQVQDPQMIVAIVLSVLALALVAVALFLLRGKWRVRPRYDRESPGFASFQKRQEFNEPL